MYALTPHELGQALADAGHLAGKDLVDIGSNTGEFLKSVAPHCKSVRGIEQVTNLSNIAKDQGFTIENKDALEAGATLGSADVFYSYLGSSDSERWINRITGENLLGTFIFGEPGSGWQRLYLLSKGASVVSVANGHFNAYVLERR